MEPDPIRAAVDALGAIPADVVPTGTTRPPKHVVARLLAHHGQTVHQHQATITQDVDGIPSGVQHTTEHAVLDVDLEALGWTQAEYDDPTITE